MHCDIMPEVEGSDHCPVKAELSGMCEGSSTFPALCTKFMPEFLGKQQKLSTFFQKVSPSKQFSAAHESNGKNVKKRTVDSSATNKNKKKQKTGPASGNLFQFFQKKSTSNQSEKPKDDNTEDRQLCQQDLNAISKIASAPVENPGSNKEDQTETPSSSQESACSEILSQECNDKSSQESTCSEKSAQDSTTSKNLDTKTQPSSGEKSENKSQLSAGWKTLFKGLPPPPLCKGHKEPCVLRTVKKQGVNRGKRFYVCAKPEGPKTNPESRCDHFQWFGKK